MEWSGRPAPPRVMLGCSERQTEHRLVQQPGMTICHDGIDSGKNSFHLVGLDRRGAMAAAEVVQLLQLILRGEDLFYRVFDVAVASNHDVDKFVLRDAC
jgi:hypothetical protein